MITLCIILTLIAISTFTGILIQEEKLINKILPLTIILSLVFCLVFLILTHLNKF